MSGFTMGPAWAAGTTCCGKPVGCTNMSDQCVLRNHRWKRRHVQQDTGDRDEAAVAEEEDGNA